MSSDFKLCDGLCENRVSKCNYREGACCVKAELKQSEVVR